LLRAILSRIHLKKCAVFTWTSRNIENKDEEGKEANEDRINKQ
jgi:hypothetical protein